MRTRRWSGALAGVLTVACVAGCAGSPTHPAAARPSSATPTTAAGSAAPAASDSSSPASLAVRLTPWRLPAPVSRAAAAVASGFVVLAGGLVGGASSPQVLQVSIPDGRVQPYGVLHAPVHDAAAAFVAGRPLVFGGGAASTIDDVQDVHGQVIAHLPTPRSDVVAVQRGDTAYVIGGYDGSAPLADVLATTDGQHFRVMARLAHGVRYPAAAVVGDALYVLGGETSSGDTADVQRVDLATGRVSVVGRLPTPLAHAGFGALGDRIVLAGGRRAGTPTALVQAYDVRSGTTTTVGSLPQALTDPASAVIGGALWLFGGEHGAAVDTVVRVG